MISCGLKKWVEQKSVATISAATRAGHDFTMFARFCGAQKKVNLGPMVMEIGPVDSP